MSSGPPRQEPSDRPGNSYTNVAADQAEVGAQFGVVHGDVRFYQAAHDATPQKKYSVGLNYLRGNMPRQAEEYIHSAFMEGHRSAEVAYYWTLSILSGRSFDHLADEDFRKLSTAFSETLKYPASQWKATVGVIFQLIQCLIAQEKRGSPDPTEFSAVLTAYHELTDEHRDEIRRHLEMILAGGIQDQLAELDAVEVAALRMGGDRIGRAWKFFQADPAPAREQKSEPPKPGLDNWAKCVLGGTASLIGIAVVLSAAVQGNGPLASVLLVLFAGAGAVVTWLGLARERILQRRQEQERRYSAREYLEWAKDRKRDDLTDEEEQWSYFARDVRRWVDFRFAEHRPKEREDRRSWDRHTAGIRSSIARELVSEYETDRPQSGAAAIDWLISFRVEEIVRSWKDGSFYSFRDRLRVPLPVSTGYFAALAAMGVTALALVLLAAGSSVLAAIFGTILVAFSIRPATSGAREVARAHLRNRFEIAENASRFATETAEWERWKAVLADTPSDVEMARWLDYDKSHVKSNALRHYGLAHRDVIAHVALIEAAPRCRRARVLFGPPRYSEYIVRLFLLTGSGVRQVAVNVDFLTGTTANEERAAFRYDSIASATVNEVGVRLHGTRRSVVDLDSAELGQKDSWKLTFAHALKLRLNNGQVIHVLVENFDMGLIDRVQEDSRYLFELARDTSGITGAVRILEAVAAEGREWIDHERARRRRRLEAYQEKTQRETAMIGDAPRWRELPQADEG